MHDELTNDYLQEEDRQQSVVGVVWSKHIEVLLLQCDVSENCVASTDWLRHNTAGETSGEWIYRYIGQQQAFVQGISSEEAMTVAHGVSLFYKWKP